MDTFQKKTSVSSWHTLPCLCQTIFTQIELISNLDHISNIRIIKQAPKILVELICVLHVNLFIPFNIVK